ncbi:MAG: alginate export family protein [Sphingorhabdus sp.]
MLARLSQRGLIATLTLAMNSPCLGQEADDSSADGVKLGLDARLRYEVIDPTAFGNGPQDKGGYLLWRVAPDIELEIAPRWRVHAQVFAAGQSGRNGGARGNDRNDFDLTQAYVEWRPEEGSYVRAGRQEMALGSGRLLAAFDGANVRRRFDGVLGQARVGNWIVVGLAASPVLVQPGVFDDESDFNRLAVGAGAVHGDVSRNSEAVYAIRTQSFVPLFGAPGGRQERFTLGARIVRTSPHLFVEAEALAQFGSAESGSNIRAWAVAGEVRAPITNFGGAQMLAGAKFSITSGDRNRSDRRITGFDPLFPNPAFTGSFPIFAPTNIASVNPALSLQWPNGNRMGIDVALMQRLTIRDQLYTLGGFAITTRGPGRDVGALWALTGSYRINCALSVNGAVIWLNAGRSFAADQRDTLGAFLNLNVSL